MEINLLINFKPYSTLFVAMILFLPSCAESDAEKRQRLEEFYDETVSLPQNEMESRLRELDPEDLPMLSEIASSETAATRAELANGSALTRKMSEYAAIDALKADRLVGQCEEQLGVSSHGEDAQLVAQCVERNW